MSLHESGQSEEALRKCSEAIAQKPHNYTLHTIKSEILADKGQIEEGITLLKNIIKKGNATPQISLGIANIYMDAKKYSKAEESLLAALKVFPEHEDLTFTLGATYEKMGRSDLAEEIFKK